MSRIVIVLLLTALVGTGAYWFYRPEAAPGIVRGFLIDTSLLPEAAKVPATTLYKWQDKQGRWHVGDTPPEGLPYETVEYRHDVNVLPSIQVEE